MGSQTIELQVHYESYGGERFRLNVAESREIPIEFPSWERLSEYCIKHYSGNGHNVKMSICCFSVDFDRIDEIRKQKESLLTKLNCKKLNCNMCEACG